MVVNEEVRDRINFLNSQSGFLTAEMVVNDAMNPDSPLHSEFEWDKDLAAHAHWIDRARQLIRSVKVIITTDTKTVRCVGYVRDPTKANGEQGYLSIDKIRTDQDLARQALVNEFNRADAALRRAYKLAIAFGIESEIEGICDRINSLKASMEDDQYDCSFDSAKLG